MVGYSYTDSPETENYFDDHITSADNLIAMLNWFEKFPEYAKHDLYVIGESYAGVYVPYMSWRMDQHNEVAGEGDFKFNLKGFMLGNPVVNWKWDGDTVYIAAGYYHALYGNELKN